MKSALENRAVAGLRAASTRKAYKSEATAHLSDDKIAILKLARDAASRAIARARKEGIPFEHDFNRGLVELLEKQDWRCALTKLPFSEEKTSLGAGGRDYSPSPDRIDATKGYMKSNVQWVLWAVNRAKGRMPSKHFDRVFLALGNKLAEVSRRGL